jgi:Rps23 Pro-64 3,4-dihydroxylase Tpa1-like proline 4-hydroxylase
LIHDIDKNDLRKRIEDTLQKHVRYNEISLMSFYYFTPGSHIPWHDDTKYRGAMTIYLLDGWNKNHGGLYLYNDNNTIKGLVPRKNLAIYHEGNVEHSVSALSSHSPVRTSIQIFFDRV